MHKLKVGELAQISVDRFHYQADQNEGKIVVVTKLVDSSEAGNLVECFVDNQFVLFPEYVLRRIQ